jgi:hypothetical protein
MAALVLGSAPPAAHGGCGCDKAPPDAASIRPNATYAGAVVTIFDEDLRAGSSYQVEFRSGTSSAVARVQAVAVADLDLADARRKPQDRHLVPQLVVQLPDLPLGPTAVTVTAGGASAPLFTIDDEALTVVDQPLRLPQDLGDYVVENVQGAVSRDGTVYFALDLTGIELPRVFQAQALGYPLRFKSDGLAFYNTQGFLMQLLKKKMPGLHSIEVPADSADSDILLYSRHEFATYFLQHGERQGHAVSGNGNWHLDGTPHIDHNHLILAIAGELDDGSVPAPGATPPLHFLFGTHSNYEQGIVAAEQVVLQEYSSIAAFDSRSGLLTSDGDAYSQKEIHVEDHARIEGSAAAVQKVEVKNDGIVDGDAEAPEISVKDRGRVRGDKRFRPARPVGLVRVQIPSGIENLGKIDLGSGQQRTIVGPATFELEELKIEGGELVIDNAAGPVTLYLSGDVEMRDQGRVTVTDFAPEKFALYLKPGKNVKCSGDIMFHGLIYGPESDIELQGNGEFFGSLVGKRVKLRQDVRVYYDPALRGTRP